MRVAFIAFLGIHGLIHIFGFTDAFGLYDFKEISGVISKPLGILWLLAALLFISTLVLYSAKVNYWWLIAFIAVVISQILIIWFWKDAKFGTLANIVILIVSIIGYQTWNFENRYKADVIESIERDKHIENEILTKEDIQHLPALVQQYIEVVGALNKPKVKNVKVSFKAEMRSKTQDWFKLTAEQHNFFDQSERFFFLKAKVKGLSTQGYHQYKDGKSSMTIKLFSTISIVKVSGDKMFEAETVTLLNDMCFLAPASLIDQRIKWKEIDSKSVKATFTNQGVTISAILYFNNKGQLINFESSDRYDINEMTKYKFSTPLKDYKPINGFNLAHYGKAIWHYPEGEFVYGRYHLQDIQYNVTGY